MFYLRILLNIQFTSLIIRLIIMLPFLKHSLQPLFWAMYIIFIFLNEILKIIKTTESRLFFQIQFILVQLKFDFFKANPLFDFLTPKQVIFFFFIEFKNNF